MLGIIKGLGLQAMTVVWTFIGYFIMGIPMAAFCADKARDLFGWQNTRVLSSIHNLNGIYTGFNFACVVLNISIFYIIYTVDWDDGDKLSKDILTESHAFENIRQYKAHIANHKFHKAGLSK